MTAHWINNIVEPGLRSVLNRGIPDFCENGEKQVAEAYDKISSRYDDFLTSAVPLAGLYNKIVWGLRDSDYVEKLLSMFPPYEDKTILDIPAGTGVFTVDLYKKMETGSGIIVSDYSVGMLLGCRERFEEAGLKNPV